MFPPRIDIGHRSSIGVAVFGQHRLSRSNERERLDVVRIQPEHAGPGDICPILQNDHSHSDRFLLWMIAANCCGAAIPSATPLAATASAFLLTNIAYLVQARPVRAFGRFVLRHSQSCGHEHRHRSSRPLDLGIRDDVAGCAYRPWNSMCECQWGRAYMACGAGGAAGRCMIR